MPREARARARALYVSVLTAWGNESQNAPIIELSFVVFIGGSVDGDGKPCYDNLFYGVVM